MLARHAVLLTPSISLRPLFSYFLFSNSFPCHRSENSPVSLAIATLPKTAVSNPCACHTCETPRGYSLSTFQPSTLQRSNAVWLIPSLFNPLRTLLRFFALAKNSTLFFPIVSALFAKKKHPRAWASSNLRPSTFNSQSSALHVQFPPRIPGGVMSFSQRFDEVRTGFERPFWVANITELFERLSYYAAFASLARYLHETL